MSVVTVDWCCFKHDLKVYPRYPKMGVRNDWTLDA